MKKVKKTLPVFIASVLAVNIAAASILNIGALAADEKYEFEDATITGEVTVENAADASGGSYLKMTESGTITMNFNAPTAGIYNIIIYGGGLGGAKQQNMSINGVSQGALAIPESESFEKIVVKSIKLQEGENTLLIEKSWGWSTFDYFEIETAVLSDIKASDTTCTDPKAIPEAQNLMNYMASVYGSHIISGQQEIYQHGPHDFEYEFEYLKNLTGHYPAIRGFDYLNSANILYGSEDGTSDRIIDWVKNKNGIATASWHITVPKNMDNYKVGDTNITWNDATYDPKLTNFVTSNVLVEGTVEREYYLAALKVLAEQLKKLQDANIPLIFRPLHEAEGGGGETGSWFWWGKDGSAVYKDIWKLTYKTLTEDYDLHNIIWEWNSYNFDTSANWYPGDEYVDIIGYDKYSCIDYSTGSKRVYHNDSAIASTFYGIMEKYNSKKMVAMAENDSFSTVENLTSEKAGWLYFCTWYDGSGSAESDSPKFLSDPMFNTEKDTIDMYQSDYCITLDELPADLYTNGNITTKPTGTKPTGTTTTTTTTEAGPTTEIKADIKKGADGYKFTLSEPIGDTLYVKLDADNAVKFANGCVGISVKMNVEYWVSYKWEIAGSDTVKIDLTKPSEISYNSGEDKVIDKALIAEIAKEAQKQDNGLVQIWWVNDTAGEQLDNSNVTVTDVYIIKSASSSDTTTTTTTVTSTETTTISTTETTKDTTTETTTTTTAFIPGEVKYGDLNLDDSISMLDLVYLNKYIANVLTLEPTQLANADCYDDGTKAINANDATALMNRLAQSISSLPVRA